MKVAPSWCIFSPVGMTPASLGTCSPPETHAEGGGRDTEMRASVENMVGTHGKRPGPGSGGQEGPPGVREGAPRREEVRPHQQR